MSVTLTILTALFSIFSFLVALFNRLDNIKPNIQVMYRDERDDQGKIHKEFIEVCNVGRVPALITEINVISGCDILTFNGETKYTAPTGRTKSQYMSLNEV